MRFVQHNPGIAPTLAMLLCVAPMSLAGCRSDDVFDPDDLGVRLRYDTLDSALERGDMPPPGELRIRLAFGGDADLDLYVTDTLQETIYFARRETRSGGYFGDDARCDAEPPRIETASYPAADTGVYRIGVDYSGACAKVANPQGFVLEARYGDKRWLKRGHSEPLRFEPIVWELVIPD